MTPRERAERIVETVLAAEFADAERDAVAKERSGTASRIRDIASRIGVACTNEWIRSELDSLAARLEFPAAIEARGQQ